MAKHRSYSVEFKRQVVQDYLHQPQPDPHLDCQVCSTMTTSTRALASDCKAPSMSSGWFASADEKPLWYRAALLPTLGYPGRGPAIEREGLGHERLHPHDLHQAREHTPMCAGDDHNCSQFELHRQKLLEGLDAERRIF